ncbi:hypothetical protein D3C78_641560 [compost metagenome]
MVADIAAFFEIGLEQPGHDLLLDVAAFGMRPERQAVRVECVRADLDRIKIVMDADFLAELHQRGMGLFQTLLAELFLQCRFLVDAFRRIIRVEAIGTPVHVDADFILHLGYGKIEPCLAEITPGADHIRYDVDNDAFHGFIFPCPGPGRGGLLRPRIPPGLFLIA